MRAGIANILRPVLVGLVLLSCWGVSVRCGTAEDRRDIPGPSHVTEGPEGIFGQIQLHVSHAWLPTQAAPESQVELWAVFVQHVGVSASVARSQAGLHEDTQPLDSGTCRPMPLAPPALATEPTGEDALVDLLDAGVLYLVLPFQSALVRPQIFPDVLPHVSGVHYRQTLPGRQDGSALGRLGLHGFGGRDVDAFEVIRRSGPDALQILQVAERPPWEAPTAHGVASPLVVRWTPMEPEADVRVTLRWKAAGQSAEGGVECRPALPGEHSFPPSVLAQVEVGSTGLEVTCGVSVLHTESETLPDGIPVVLHLRQSSTVPLLLMP